MIEHTIDLHTDHAEENISVWNPDIQNNLKRHDIKPDPWNTDHEYILENIERMEQVINSGVLDHEFETLAFIHGHLSGSYRSLASQEDDSIQFNSYLAKSKDHAEKVIEMLSEHPEHREFIVFPYYNLGSVYLHSGQYDKTRKIALKLIHEFQDINVGPFPEWVASNYGIGLLTGIAKVYHEDDELLLSEEAKQAAGLLHDIVRQYENEVGLMAAKRLHQYYFRLEDEKASEDVYHQGFNILHQLDDNEYIQSKWNNRIHNDHMQRQLDSRGWNYAVTVN